MQRKCQPRRSPSTERRVFVPLRTLTSFHLGLGCSSLLPLGVQCSQFTTLTQLSRGNKEQIRFAYYFLPGSTKGFLQFSILLFSPFTSTQLSLGAILQPAALSQSGSTRNARHLSRGCSSQALRTHGDLKCRVKENSLRYLIASTAHVIVDWK